MADVRTLGSVDLLDKSKYSSIPASSESGVPTYEELPRRIRNTSQINLGQFRKGTQPFGFDVVVVGGGSWTTVLANIEAIQVELDDAAEFSMHQIGSQILYSEAGGDQAAPTTWNVKCGKIWEIRSQRLVHSPGPRTTVHVELLCEPGAVA